MTDKIEAYLYVYKNETFKSYNGYVQKRTGIYATNSSFTILSDGRRITVSKFPCTVYRDTLWMEEDDILKAQKLFVKHYKDSVINLMEVITKLLNKIKDIENEGVS